MQAFMASPLPTTNADWYPNSSTSHHITSNLANLNLKAEEYGGSNQIRFGNGTGLFIKHVGNTQISTPYFHFNLYDVLHVHQIKKNLLPICAIELLLITYDSL